MLKCSYAKMSTVDLILHHHGKEKSINLLLLLLETNQISAGIIFSNE